MPYYLFNGTLVARIERQVAHLKAQYPTIRFTSTAYFGFEREIFEVLEQRVGDVKRGAPAALMACDGCKFRDFAVAHGQGGHHHDDSVPHSHDHDHEHSHDHAHPHEHPHPHEHDHNHAHPHDHEHAHPHTGVSS